MNPKIITKDSIILVGMSFYGDPFANSSLWSEENEIGSLWKRFMNFISSKPKAIQNIIHPNQCFEIHFTTDETHINGNREVFIGVMVEDIHEVPLECVIKKLPKTEYAIFNIKGEKITSDWLGEIFMKWMPISRYKSHYNYSIQVYDDRFKGMDKIDESEIDVYIPIERESI